MHQYEEIKKHLHEMLEIGAICRSTGPWASPIVLVCKKDGGLRFCIDLRKLINKTIEDAQSLPRIEDSRLFRLEQPSLLVLIYSQDIGKWN